MDIANKMLGRYQKMFKEDGENFAIAKDRNTSDVKTWYDTHIPMMNAIYSGSIYKGMPDNRVIILAGESQVGKSYFNMQNMKSFQMQSPDNVNFLFDSEGAVTNEQMLNIGIDIGRVIKFPIDTLENLKNKMISIIEDYINEKGTFTKAMREFFSGIKEKKIDDYDDYTEKNFKLLEKIFSGNKAIADYIGYAESAFQKFVTELKNGKKHDEIIVDEIVHDVFYKIMISVDSIGLLPSQAEIDNALADKDTNDMGRRAKLIKSIYTVATNKSSIAKIPIIMVAHIYEEMKQYGKKIVSGGQGNYLASSILFIFTKSKLTEGTDEDKKQIGIKVRVRAEKSRFVKENKVITVNLDFNTGIDRWSNIYDYAKEKGLLKELTKQSVEYIDGKKYTNKEIYENPEKFFGSKDFLEKLEEIVANDFLFKSASEEVEHETEQAEQTQELDIQDV